MVMTTTTTMMTKVMMTTTTMTISLWFLRNMKKFQCDHKFQFPMTFMVPWHRHVTFPRMLIGGKQVMECNQPLIEDNDGPGIVLIVNCLLKLQKLFLFFLFCQITNLIFYDLFIWKSGIITRIKNNKISLFLWNHTQKFMSNVFFWTQTFGGKFNSNNFFA